MIRKPKEHNHSAGKCNIVLGTKAFSAQILELADAGETVVIDAHKDTVWIQAGNTWYNYDRSDITSGEESKKDTESFTSVPFKVEVAFPPEFVHRMQGIQREYKFATDQEFFKEAIRKFVVSSK